FPPRLRLHAHADLVGVAGDALPRAADDGVKRGFELLIAAFLRFHVPTPNGRESFRYALLFRRPARDLESRPVQDGDHLARNGEPPFHFLIAGTNGLSQLLDRDLDADIGVDRARLADLHGAGTIKHDVGLSAAARAPCDCLRSWTVRGSSRPT